MESVAEQYKNLLKEQHNTDMSNTLKYIKSYMIVRRLYLSGQVNVEILERLNKRNAEQLNCVPLDFKSN